MGKARAVALATGIVLALLIGWRFHNILSGGGDSPQRGGGRRGGGGSQKVAVGTAVMDTMTYPLEVVGNVESTQNVDIVARTPGLVQEVLYREGDAVKRGEVLARIAAK